MLLVWSANRQARHFSLARWYLTTTHAITTIKNRICLNTYMCTWGIYVIHHTFDLPLKWGQLWNGAGSHKINSTYIFWTSASLRRSSYEKGSSYEKVSVITGHCIYKLIWTPVIGEELVLQPEDDNEHDKHTVAMHGCIVRCVLHILSHVCHGSSSYMVAASTSKLEERKNWRWPRSLTRCLFKTWQVSSVIPNLH